MAKRTVINKHVSRDMEKTKIIGKFSNWDHLREYVIAQVLKEFATLHGYKECRIENAPFTYELFPIRLICDDNDVGGFATIKEAIDFILSSH